MQKTKNKLTEGSLLSALASLTVPIVLSNMLQTAYQLVDTFWVGRLGANAVAAVSLSFPVIFLLISLGAGFTIAGTILAAQYRGKGSQKSIDYVAAQTIIAMLFVSLIVTLLGYILSNPLIKLMGAEPQILKDAVSYMQISFFGTIFLFGYFIFQSLMRGIGDVKTPTYIILFSVTLNFILDPLFIFGYGFIPALGVAGAAIATVVTQGIAATIGIFMLFSGKYGIHLKKRNLAPDFKLIKKMFRLGFPASMEQSARALALTVMTFLVASFGTTIVAAYGIGSRMFSFALIPALGLSLATSTLVGQNMGAGKIERAEKISKISALIGFIFLTLIGVIMFILAKEISAFFVPNEKEVISISASLIRILALAFGFMGVEQVLIGAFRGSGNTFVSMILVMISYWVLRFPLAYVLSKHTSLSYSGIWWSFPITNVAAALIALIWFLRGTWKNKKLTEEFRLAEETAEEAMADEGAY